MTYRELLTEGQTHLTEGGIDDAKNDAWLFMERLFDLTRSRYYQIAETAIEEEERIEDYRTMIKKRLERIPLQLLLGMQSFMGYDFGVSEDVLIPRKETELLAEEALAILKKEPGIDRVLEIGTGSGCLAISLKKERPAIHMTATDLSEKALAKAKENAKRLQADITWLFGDLFEPVTGTYPMIVSNPPYIPTSVIESLEPEVRLHEPHSALDGGEDGLAIYRRLIKGCADHLSAGGYLLLEIGYDQKEALTKEMEDSGLFDNIECRQDLAGYDRLVIARRKKNV